MNNTIKPGFLLVTIIACMSCVNFDHGSHDSSDWHGNLQNIEISNQPSSQVVLVGQPVTFMVNAKGSFPLSYKWYFDGFPMIGVETNRFTLSHANADDDGKVVRVDVYNKEFKVGSNPAFLDVRPLGLPSIKSFSAIPSSIQQGDVSYLSWTVEGASETKLEPDCEAASNSWGVVKPGSSTTYTLVASNEHGEARASVLVDVVPGSSKISNMLTTMESPRWRHTVTSQASRKILIAGGGAYWPQTGYLQTAECLDLASGQLRSVGQMMVPRAGHFACALKDGGILIGGGQTLDRFGTLITHASAECFSVEKEKFTATGSMICPRYDATATLLGDGRVLIVGGKKDSGYLATAEIYDPNLGAFSATGSMLVSRSGHTATRLANGDVLIAGGQNSSGVLASAEIFSPNSGAFSGTASMDWPRRGHSADVLPSGDVLICGGCGPSSKQGFVPQAFWSVTECYKPQMGTFSPDGSLCLPRSGHVSAVLPDGRLILIGGEGAEGSLREIELYDTGSKRFSVIGDMHKNRNAAVGCLVDTNRIIVFGGTNNLHGALLCAEEISYK